MQGAYLLWDVLGDIGLLVLLVVVCTVSSAADALRDRWHGRVDDFRWHVVKWLSFYPGLALSVFLVYPPAWLMAVLIALSFAVWLYVYRWLKW